MPDRRRHPTPFLSRHSLKGRRRGVRRKRDLDRHIYVDRYGLHSVLIIFTAIILCIVDAVFTLQLVDKGAREVNPVMHFLLGFGPGAFLGVKYALTASSLLFLLVHSRRRLWGNLQVRHILAAVPFLYSLLILWEVYLNLHLS